MSTKNLRLEQLELDLLNPRISKASGQREATEKIVAEQGVKIINLAESIAANGLNPMDRFLVLRNERTGKYAVLEGNRRIVALKLLRNPALANDVEMKDSFRKRLDKARENFDLANFEPLPCYVVADRAQGNSWILQRHTGADEGRGIVDWSGIAAGRFRGRAPELQALDFVRQHANLNDNQKEMLEGKFPITNLQRLLATPAVRERLGFDIEDGKLITSLPPAEAVKPLRRIVLDLAEKRVRVTQIKSKAQQLDYVSKLGPGDSPNLSKKTGSTRAVDSFAQADFGNNMAQAKKPSRSAASVRRAVVPRSCKLSISNPKISEIMLELKSLLLEKHPHSISVLLRVFLECSVDEYLVRHGMALKENTPNGAKDKSLRKKVHEVVDHMVGQGAERRDLDGVNHALGKQDHPFSPDTLNAYVHNRFFSPSERDLTTAWDNAQPFFERIWS